MAPIGSHGDTRPLAALAIKLRERGHEVAFCSTKDDRNWIEKLAFPFWPVEYDFMVNLKEKSRLGGASKEAMELVTKEIDLQFAALNGYAGEYDLIFGSGIQFAGASVAERLDKPYYHLFYSPQVFPSSYHPPVWIKQNNLPRWINRMLWKTVNKGLNKAIGSVVNRHRAEAGQKELTDYSSFYIKPAVLAVDKELAPLPPDIKEEFIHINYCFLEEEEKLSPELKSFINAGEPPVYIGFGSMVEHDKEQLLAVINRLSERYNLRFILSKGELQFSDEIANPNIFVADYLPHNKLFPKMAAIVHHGGMGTTYSALRAGVPQLIIPHHLDQFFYARKVHELGLSPKPVYKKDVAKRLAKAIPEAVYEGIYRRNAKSLQSRLESHNGVDELIEQLKL